MLVFSVKLKQSRKELPRFKNKTFSLVFWSVDETNRIIPHYILLPLHTYNISNFFDLRETLTLLCPYSLILRRKEMPMSPNWSAIQVYTANVYRQTTNFQNKEKCSSPEFLKVSKSQKKFILKLRCPKSERKLWQNSVLGS